MEQTDTKSQWRVKVKTTLSKTKAHQIWPFFQDFFGICKWFPNHPISYGINGNNGEIGSIRYCQGFSGFSIPSQKRSTTEKEEEEVPVINWSKERLIAIDSEEKCLRYEIVDSNLGLHNYVSTIKISKKDINGGEEEEDDGCLIEWSVSVDPVDGFSLQDLVKKYEIGMHNMVLKMEEELANVDEA